MLEDADAFFVAVVVEAASDVVDEGAFNVKEKLALTGQSGGCRSRDVC